VISENNRMLDVWLDAGLIVELTFHDSVTSEKAIEAILNKQDITPMVAFVNVRSA
jgi:hypothetical protein